MIEPVNKSKPWTASKPPGKILVMRFQALGDVAITLPYLQNLKENMPEICLDFLTRKEVAIIPTHLKMFDRVMQIGGGRRMRWQVWWCLMMLPALLIRRYDVVIDLQNNALSRLIRKLLFAKAWSEFDRASPISASERTIAAINNAGISTVFHSPEIHLIKPPEIIALMKLNGWKEGSDIIILNPAGAFASRNWPLEYYLTFARHWLQINSSIQFVILGLGAIENKAEYFKNMLGDSVVNLVGKTTMIEAYAIVKNASLMLSEDSGLMHMAWTQGVPTLAIFGSSRSDWSAPAGTHSYCFNSSDLPCGNCLLPQCKFGDNRCLTRWFPDLVFEKSRELLVKI